MSLSQRLHFTQSELKALAHRILDMDPDPAPHFRVMRDLLGCSPDHPGLNEAQKSLHSSRWIQLLAGSQHSNGTWGRFHTQDSSIKTPFSTTEFAILRALALGLDQHSLILQRASAYISDHLQGKVIWLDPPEKHDHPGLWAVNIRSISAAMLAFINPNHPRLGPMQNYWTEVLEETFASGRYDRKAELAKQRELTGVPSRGFYAFHNYYPLIILSSKPGLLTPQLETQMTEFVMHRQDGMYYVYEKRLDTFPGIGEVKFSGWLRAQEILSRFQAWNAFAPELLNWLWDQRNADGLWDIGSKARHSYYFPLSESWRSKNARVIDCSVRILCLLQQMM